MKKNKAAKPVWLPDWPAEPGYYWFYGKKFGTGENRLHYVQFIKENQAGITDGHFIYSNQAKGVWQPAQVPDLPEVEPW